MSLKKKTYLEEKAYSKPQIKRQTLKNLKSNKKAPSNTIKDLMKKKLNKNKRKAKGKEEPVK